MNCMLALLKKHYLILSLVIFASAIVCDYYASLQPLESVVIATISNGVVTNRDMLQTPNSIKLMKLFSTGLYTLAYSIFISVFVLQRFESESIKQTKLELHELQRIIQEDTISGVFKTVVPEEIYEAIKRDILLCHEIRKNACYTLDFAKDGDRFRLKQTIQYEMCNYGMSTISNPITVVRDYVPERDVMTHAVCSIKDKKIFEYDKGRITSNSRIVESTNEDGNSVIRPVIDIPPNTCINVTLVFELIYAGPVINDAIFSKTPIIDATLLATYPKGYEFSLFQSLSTPLIRQTHDETTARYLCKGGILPQQGFAYTLRKRVNAEHNNNDAQNNAASSAS